MNVTREELNRKRREQYAAMKEKIFDIIGRVCALRSSRCKGPLTIDHWRGRAYALENVGGNKLKIYLEEARQGELRPLCLYHNSADGARKGNAGFRNRGHHIIGRKCLCVECEKLRTTQVFFKRNVTTGRLSDYKSEPEIQKMLNQK